MFHNIKKYTLFFAGALALTACTTELDVQPANSVKEELVFVNTATSKSSLKAMVTGLYDMLSDGDVASGSLRNAELLPLEGETQWRGTFTGLREIARQAITTPNDDVANFWLDSYQTIHASNQVIENLNLLTSDAEKRSYEGEALFIRSLATFQLIRFFTEPYDATTANDANSGIPLASKTTDFAAVVNGSLQVSRNTMNESYNFVINDLIKAISLLPTSNGFFATSHAANALLARVYLQKGDFANAATTASRVIASGAFRLSNNYSDAFGRTTNSQEDVFAVQITSQDGINDKGANSMVTFFQNRTLGGRGDVRILARHLNLYEAGDARKDLFAKERSADTWWFCGKWTNPVAQNINIIRLAEMYLIRAEANFMANTAVGDSPLNDINVIRNRAKLPSLTSVDLNAIKKERKLELAFEGHRIHDLRRWKENAGAMKFDNPKLTFPIPQREMDVNTKMVQNIGYR